MQSVNPIRLLFLYLPMTCWCLAMETLLCGYERIEISHIFGFSEGTLSVKYLGLPLAAKKLLNIHFNPLIDQITSFISRWTNSYLSLAGRAKLIKAVLQGVE